jgi:AcrR family transcriptional regulator
MDNATRSDITRKKAVDAAFVILARDGTSGLTFEALSKESGISRGGLIHQFHNKEGVIAALLDYQRDFFENIGQTYLKSEGASKAEKTLSAHMAMYQASVDQPVPVARAVLAALVENTKLVGTIKEGGGATIEAICKEATDADLSMLRYFAASGIAYNMLLGLAPVSADTSARLFARLMDESAWGQG